MMNQHSYISTANPVHRQESFFKPVLQAKLEINQPGDISFFNPPVIPIQRKCEECEKEEETQLHRKETSAETIAPSSETENYIGSLNGKGRNLSVQERSFFEPRFGYDFSQVKIHNDTQAHRSADNINAQAYTQGNNIVFAKNKYQPGSDTGKKLMAHELTHVVQQKANAVQPKLVQRCANAADGVDYDNRAKAIKKNALYKKLASKKEADEILVEAKKKDDCLYYMDKLELLFAKKDAPPAAVEADNVTETATAVADEQKRLALPEEKAKTGDEEAAADAVKDFLDSKASARKGEFGGGTYHVDNRDPNNIIVRAKVKLFKKGKVDDAYINSIISLEDAIEKEASTQGYILDLIFMDKPDTETFRIDVHTEGWTNATNWSGGDPNTFAHELHHCLAFPLDRYDYIQSHAENELMKMDERIHWFLQQVRKTLPDNPDSLMAGGAGTHMLDDDVCTVAGLNIPACVTARENKRKVSGLSLKAFQLCFKARSLLTGINPPSPFDDPRFPTNDIKISQATSIAQTIFGEKISMEQVAEIITQMQYRLGAGLSTKLSEAADKECASKETFLINNIQPLHVCPQFFTMSESEQIDSLVKEAARMVRISERSSETACADNSCGAPCGGFNNAPDWVKYIRCVDKL